MHNKIKGILVLILFAAVIGHAVEGDVPVDVEIRSEVGVALLEP